jgi:hypothetical protein
LTRVYICWDLNPYGFASNNLRLDKYYRNGGIPFYDDFDTIIKRIKSDGMRIWKLHGSLD